MEFVSRYSIGNMLDNIAIKDNRLNIDLNTTFDNRWCHLLHCSVRKRRQRQPCHVVSCGCVVRSQLAEQIQVLLDGH